MWCTVQVSNHPRAGDEPAPAEAAASWKTVYDGAVVSAAEGRKVVDELASWFHHARIFHGRGLGLLDYQRSGPRVVYARDARTTIAEG